MTGAWYSHEFEAVVERHGVGRERQIFYTVLFLPDELAGELPFDQHPQLRIEGEIGDVPMAGAFVSAGDGRRYVMISPDVLREAGIGVGSLVTMRFRIADQDAVDVPPALATSLGLDAEAMAAWEALTTGRRRALAHLVASARTDSTRQRRVAGIILAITGRPVPPALRADVGRLDYLFGRRRG